MKMKTVKQSGTGGKSAPQGTATNSGSRPMGGKIPIPSSAPAKQQKLRG